MLLNKFVIMIIAVLSVYSVGLSLYLRSNDHNDESRLLAKGSGSFEMPLMSSNRESEDLLLVNGKEIKQEIPEQQEEKEKEKAYENLDELITAFEILYECEYLTAMEKIDYTQNDLGQDTLPIK